MNNPVFFSKTIAGNCKYLCCSVRCNFNISNVFLQSNVGGLYHFSSLSKSPKKTSLARRYAKSHIRTFSFKESLESALVTHSTIFKWITESTIVEYAKTSVIAFHDYSGLPWWMSIILTTCFVRGIITFPIALYQNHVIARLENIKKEMDNIVNDIKYDLNREVRRNKWPEKIARRKFNILVRKEWKQLIERDNCHPAKIVILAMFQIPTWIIFSTAFRNIVYRLPYSDGYAEMKWLEMSVGGVAWFPNLLIPDNFVLPIALGLVNLTIIEIQTLMHRDKRSRLQRYATNFFRGFALFMVPVAASVPSCLALYWVTSSTFGLCQNLAFLSPKFRRLMGIPSTPSTIPKPYTHLADQFRNKFRR